MAGRAPSPGKREQPLIGRARSCAHTDPLVTAPRGASREKKVEEERLPSRRGRSACARSAPVESVARLLRASARLMAKLLALPNTGQTEPLSHEALRCLQCLRWFPFLLQNDRRVRPRARPGAAGA